jgi:hypothetical protein
MSDEAGKRAWDGLTSLVGRIFGRPSSQAVKQIEPAAPHPETIHELARALATEAESDPVATTALRDWMANTERALDQSGDVTNTVSGTVHGPVVQARDIHGGITF